MRMFHDISPRAVPRRVTQGSTAAHTMGGAAGQRQGESTAPGRSTRARRCHRGAARARKAEEMSRPVLSHHTGSYASSPLRSKFPKSEIGNFLSYRYLGKSEMPRRLRVPGTLSSTSRVPAHTYIRTTCTPPTAGHPARRAASDASLQLSGAAARGSPHGSR